MVTVLLLPLVLLNSICWLPRLQVVLPVDHGNSASHIGTAYLNFNSPEEGVQVAYQLLCVQAAAAAGTHSSETDHTASATQHS